MFLKKIKKFDGTRSICLFGIPVFSYKKSNSKCLSYLSKLSRVCDSSEYARSQGVTVGKNVQFVIHPYPFSFPDFGSEPYLIEIGDNVVVSFGVSFLTHDGAWYNCSKYINSSEDMRRYGRIKIGNNCFIGCRSILLPGVTTQLSEQAALLQKMFLQEKFGLEILLVLLKQRIVWRRNFCRQNKILSSWNIDA